MRTSYDCRFSNKGTCKKHGRKVPTRKRITLRSTNTTSYCTWSNRIWKVDRHLMVDGNVRILYFMLDSLDSFYVLSWIYSLYVLIKIMLRLQLLLCLKRLLVLLLEKCVWMSVDHYLRLCLCWWKLHHIHGRMSNFK